MTHQYKKLPVKMKMWMQFNIMPRTDYEVKISCIVILKIYQVILEILWFSGRTFAFGSIGHGFESEHRLFSHHSASAFSKLRSLL